jgi:hypothetical protein
MNLLSAVCRATGHKICGEPTHTDRKGNEEKFSFPFIVSAPRSKKAEPIWVKYNKVVGCRQCMLQLTYFCFQKLSLEFIMRLDQGHFHTLLEHLKLTSRESNPDLRGRLRAL